ncbi:MAG: hypothetical protein GY826_40735 [Fuerstiella sp.]|nr:hypothetical protein [Fuerstiella sp.]
MHRCQHRFAGEAVVVGRGRQTEGVAAADAEGRKKARYRAEMALIDADLVPFVMESFGGCGPEAQRVVDRLVRDARSRGSWISRMYILQKLSFVCMSWAAKMVCHRLPVVDLRQSQLASILADHISADVMYAIKVAVGLAQPPAQKLADEH